MTLQSTIIGKAYVLGDNVDTDQIIPAQYLTFNPAIAEEYRQFGKYALSSVPPAQAGLPKGHIPFHTDDEYRSPYQIIVAGKNFGCGSSREHAPIALDAAGIEAVVAEFYARIFFRNGRPLSASAPRMESANPLQQSVASLKGVRAGRAELLRRLGIETIADVLFHFPRSYEDLTDVRPIDSLSAGSVQTVHGEVVEIAGRELADGRCIVSVVLSEGPHCLEGIWFNQPYAARAFRYGQRLAFSGKPKWHRDHWQMASPRVQV